MSGQDAWKDSAGRNEEHWIDQEWRLGAAHVCWAHMGCRR